MKDFFSGKRLLLLVGVFLISVLIRIPNLNRPLSKHHEFCTAVALQVMTVWEQEGISNVHFAPAMNYAGSSNKFINNNASTTGKLIDENGNYYYVSHPPLGYYLPYVVFNIFRVEPGVLSLQVFNLFIHFLSALLVSGIILTLAGLSSGSFRMALIGFTVYTFSTGPLWFNSNVYMSDTLVVFFFLLGIFLYSSWFSSRRMIFLYLHFIAVFLMTYTSWLGVFYAAGFSLYWLMKERSDYRILSISLLNWSAVFIAGALMIYQYSGIAGFENYFDQMIERYSERGSLASGSGFLSAKLHELLLLPFNYITAYFPFVLLISGWLIIRYFFKRKIRLQIGLKHMIWLSLAPVLLLHLVLLNYSGHDFTTLYGAPFIAVIVPFILDSFNFNGLLSNRLVNSIVIASVVVSVGLYYMINLPGERSWKGDLYAEQQTIGLTISQNSAKDEVVYLVKYPVHPQVVYYSQRNIIGTSSFEKARKLFRDSDDTKAVFFIYHGNQEVDTVHLKK